ncbi:MAG: HutD family protein [Planctomycetes bacterium]|nr:HutD family protein [Planctomycetota bacterium]
MPEAKPFLTWLPHHAQRVVPWRNGLGQTREVAIDPPDGSVERGFRWRVSCAGVAADGPFSVFPGVDRSLWLVRGDGVELDVDGRRVLLDQRWQRVDFAGEAPVHARLRGGPIDDLNVMVRRSDVLADAALLELSEGATAPLSLPAGQHVLLGLQGVATVFGGVLGGSAGGGDAVRCDGAIAGELLAMDGAVVVLVVTFVARHGVDP